MIEFTCPYCGLVGEFDDYMRGQLTFCENCQRQYTVDQTAKQIIPEKAPSPAPVQVKPAQKPLASPASAPRAGGNPPQATGPSKADEIVSLVAWTLFSGAFACLATPYAFWAAAPLASMALPLACYRTKQELSRKGYYWSLIYSIVTDLFVFCLWLWVVVQTFDAATKLRIALQNTGR